MSLETDAALILDNRLFHKIREDMRQQLFEAWLVTDEISEREAIYQKLRALEDLYDYIETTANTITNNNKAVI